VSVKGPAAVPAAEDDFFASPAANAPTLTLSQGYVAPGGSVSVSGTGFGPNEKITVSLPKTVVGHATSLADGSVPAFSVTLPSTAGFGPTALVAPGNSSKKAAAAGV